MDNLNPDSQQQGVDAPSVSINNTQPRKSSLDKQFSGLHDAKRSAEGANTTKADLHDQYAPSGFIGQAWNKFARGIDGTNAAPK